MIKRLRPAYTPGELSSVYSGRYDHTRWADHIQRVAFTIGFVREVMTELDCRTVADLSCGDGAIGFGTGVSGDHLFLGDLVHNPKYEFSGPIEETIDQIPHVDLFILSETLEHVDDPGALLAKIRTKASTLVLSTPDGEVDTGNPEHYWGWDRDGIELLLEESGWWPDRSVLFTPDVPQAYYTYQIWMATSDEP